MLQLFRYFETSSSDDVMSSLQQTSENMNIPIPELVPILIKELIPITFVQGPVQLSEYTNSIYNKHIYIFGEIHNLSVDCADDNNYHVIPIQHFILETLTNHPELLIDVFVETPFHSIKYPLTPNQRRDRPNSYIQNIVKFFEPCFNINKDDCQYDNVRMHYSDIRKIPYILKYLKMYKDISTLSQLILVQDLDHEIVNYVSKLLQEFDKIFPVDIPAILENSKIQKQLDNIQDEGIKEIIYEYFFNKMLGYEQAWYTIRDLLESFVNSQDITYIHNIKRYITSFLDFIVIMMDFYIVCRIFRELHPSPQNIIIYVGVWHINIYHEILSKLNFDRINSVNTENTACLNITEFVPFFNK